MGDHFLVFIIQIVSCLNTQMGIIDFPSEQKANSLILLKKHKSVQYSSISLNLLKASKQPSASVKLINAENLHKFKFN